MKFYVLGLKHQEDVFYNFEKKDDVFDLSAGCLLPSVDVAEQLQEDHLSTEYFIMPIHLFELNEKGSATWTYKKRWDDRDA